MPKTQLKLVDLSILSIVKFFLVIIILGFIYWTREVWAILFVSLILAAVISPAAATLAKLKIPRSVSVIIFIIIFFSLIGLIITMIVPPILEQSKQLSANLPQYSKSLNTWFASANQYLRLTDENFKEVVTAVKGYFAPEKAEVFDRVMSFFGGILSFIVMLVISFYLSVEEDGVNRVAKYILPPKFQPFFIDLIAKIQRQIVNWLKGQFVLSLIIGLLVYLALLILGVDYALILALLAFVGEFIPYLGPVLSAIPAVFVAFVASPILGLFVLIIFIIIQQAENHILVPKIMERAVGLNPVISIVALLIGAKLAGIVGVILAIPVTTAIVVIVKEFYAAGSEDKTPAPRLNQPVVKN
jgi:predicted PurR-regulated permease PerM